MPADTRVGGDDHARARDHAGLERREFPPGLDWFGFRSAIYHEGLRFLKRELVAAAMDTWGERYLLERMLRIGVRFGMVDEIVAEYHPSKR